MQRRQEDRDVRDRWARLRFLIVGPLLASPPKKGELRVELERLAARVWKHPETQEPVQFGRSTIERWYYLARDSGDPLQSLRQRLRRDRGESSLSVGLQDALRAQFKSHPSWSYQLHTANLEALIREQPSLGAAPSESSVRRFLQSRGLYRRPRKKADTEGARRAASRFEEREVRSFEVEYVGALWHLDFHECSRTIVTPRGEHCHPALLGILDDHSRLACHVQWYLAEDAENLIHGLVQAILKRGVPRALMTDNGSAMLALETRTGLAELGISHELTLPYSAYQNGKQESFWGSVEGRLLAMLEGEERLTLKLLNQATQAWLEADYQQRLHSELGTTPFERFRKARSVLRPSPDAETLRRAFLRQETRRQRRSDGTISVEGIRFEVPSRYETLRVVTIRYARWDLSSVDLVDERSAVILAKLLPLDRLRNAQHRRRRRDRVVESTDPESPIRHSPEGRAPLLRQMIDDQACTGDPPAYLPKDEEGLDEPDLSQEKNG
jgi:transposase InsO family protein